jgi:hypothetical protein
MNLSVSEPNKSDIYKIVDYFTHSETTFIKGMGADKSKLRILEHARPCVRNVCIAFDLHLIQKKPQTKVFSMTI